MSAPTFHRPNTVAEAVALLGATEGSRPIAGGSDLMIQLRLGHRNPTAVVDLTLVEGLRGIGPDGRIGAATTMRDLLDDPFVSKHLGALRDAADLLGGRQIQTVATLAGNVCNASPAAETSGPLLVHDTVVEIAGPAGVREVAILDFWTGPGRTVLGPGEIVIAFRPLATTGRSAYRRLELRRSVDIAVVAASARVVVTAGVITEASLGVTAVAPTAIRVPEAEGLLVGTPVSELPGRSSAVASAVSAASSPIDDARAGATYRRAMIGVLAVRAVEAALPRSGHASA